jgi:hypothetical protein
MMYDTARPHVLGYMELDDVRIRSKLENQFVGATACGQD